MTYVDEILAIRDAIPGARFFQTLDKKPIRDKWKIDATDDLATIEKRWGGDAALRCQVAMAVPVGMVAIDVDVKEGKVGEKQMRALMKAHPDFEAFIKGTRCHQTQSGGWHFFGYDRRGTIDGQPDLAQDVNLRTGGLGYVIAPATEGYSVVVDKPILDLPDAFYDILAKAKSGTSTPASKNGGPAEGAWMREGDGRNNALASYLGSQRHYNPEYNSDTMMTIARQWNHNTCEDLLDDHELDATVKSIMRYPSEPRGKDKAQAQPASDDLPQAPGAVDNPKWEEEYPFPVLHEEAYHGVLGAWTQEMAPHTEADPAALLFQLMARVMNMVGFGTDSSGEQRPQFGANGRANGPHIRLGGAVHPARLFPVIVGASAKARKGHSDKEVSYFLKQVDADLVARSRLGGFASGEGLVAAVSDKYDRQGELIEVVEKRIIVYETELASLLAAGSREGSRLSPLIRNAYDGDPLENRKSKETQCAVDAFVSLIGHITEEELRIKLSEGEIRNGFANRLMFVCARRQRKLPLGGMMELGRFQILVERMKKAVRKAQKLGELKMSPECEALWAVIYDAFSDEAGVAGALLARAETHTLRMAVAYAALDGSETIEVHHLNAAYAAWKYVEASTRRIFRHHSGDPNAQKLLQELRDVYPYGLTHTDEYNLLGRHVSAPKLTEIRKDLIAKGLVQEVKETAKTHPLVWNFAVPLRSETAPSEMGCLGTTPRSETAPAPYLPDNDLNAYQASDYENQMRLGTGACSEETVAPKQPAPEKDKAQAHSAKKLLLLNNPLAGDAEEEWWAEQERQFYAEMEPHYAALRSKKSAPAPYVV